MLCVCVHPLVLTRVLSRKRYDFPHFADEETEAQRGEETCPRLVSYRSRVRTVAWLAPEPVPLGTAPRCSPGISTCFLTAIPGGREGPGFCLALEPARKVLCALLPGPG